MNYNFRKYYSILGRTIKGKPCIFLDGPAGTQVPDAVIEAISDYYKSSNANTHGAFVTSAETDEVLSSTRSLASEFLGADGGHNISFGQNMTSLAFSLSRSFERMLHPGDEVLITQLDHEANRGPWLTLRAKGIIVREVGIHSNGTLDYDDFRKKINERTRLVCMGMASNLTGAVNNVSSVRKWTHEVGAYLLVDAVHFAPHFSINATELDVDFLLCSAYKFYGPHVGLLYARTGLLDQLPTDRLRTTRQYAPYSIETGTLNHAAIAGVKAALSFIKNLGSGDTNTAQFAAAFRKISNHENQLAMQLYDALSKMQKVHLIGPDFSQQRAPTLSFLHESYPSSELCKYLAAENIFAWSGHFYAVRAAEVLDLNKRGGVTRMGISAYTTEEEVDKTVDILKSL